MKSLNTLAFFLFILFFQASAFGDEQTLVQPKALRLYGSLGASEIFSNQNTGGGRIALGAEGFLTDARRVILGATITTPLSTEKIGGVGAGRISRINFLLTPGYYLISDCLYVEALAGLSTISGESPNFDGKIKPTFGAVVGFRLPLAKNLDWGMNLSFEHTGEASDGIGQIGANVGCAITGQANSHDCNSTGTAPTANVVSVNFVLGLGF